MKESKNDKFKRLKDKRIDNFKLSADRLGKLSNKYYFEYSEEERAEVLKEIDDTCKKLKSAFN